jgi:hypothetical protein
VDNAANDLNKMKISHHFRSRIWMLLVPACLLLAVKDGWGADAGDAKTNAPAASGDLVPLDIKLPNPAFKGTPPQIKQTAAMEPMPDKPRTAMMVPKGLTNLAPSAKVTCSDRNATSDMLAKITDGDKEASDSSIIDLRKGSQWVQMDLGRPCELFALVVWHAFNSPKVYHSVIVQVSDDADFISNVRTVFNNDQENKSGLGMGTNLEYFETHEGKLIDAKGVKARYVRFYSRGSTESPLNEYTEIEVYGRPAK